MPSRPRVLILLENLPLDRDARVRKEAIALRDAGFDVTVIAQRGRRRQPIDGVRVADYPPPPEGTTTAGFLLEYAWSLAAAAVLTAREVARGRLRVVQACNPPDLYWAIALPLKALRIRFVFDHHDLSPEVYQARGGRPGGLVHRGLLAMERATFAVADRVISTNDSVRQVALDRGRKQPGHVVVVRNGPELHRLDTPAADPALRRGHRHLAVWVGVIGIDDGVDEAIRAWQYVTGRAPDAPGPGLDAQLVLIGEGERKAACEDLARELGIEDLVHFTGWQEADDVYRWLATADLALALDPPGPRAERSTMMKIMEYMASGLPVVAHRIHETRISAGDAGRYVPHDPRATAEAVVDLLQNEAERQRMGHVGRQRIRDGLSWDAQSQTYVALFRELTGTS